MNEENMKSIPLLVTILFCTVISACGTVSGMRPAVQQAAMPPSEIRPESWSPPPSCVNLSVERNENTNKIIDGDYRESVGAHLLSKGYRLTGDLGCRHVLVTSITQNTRGFFGFFSRAVFSARAELSDVTKQKTLWSANASVDYSDGALPFSLVGISTGIYKASESMGREKELMALDSLSRKLLNSLPYLPAPSGMPDLDERPLQDMDKWLSTFAEVDRPQALLKITQSAYSNDLKERAYIRLCKLENAPIHRRRWALFKASLDETEPAVDVLLQGGAQTQNDSESQFLLGRLYTALSRYGDADQAYVRASALNPGKALYFEGLAYVNTRSGNYERALAAYEKIIELTPDQAYAYMSMAEVNLSAGQAHEAVNNYAKAADLLFMSKDVQALQKIVEKQASIRTTDVSADPLTRQLTDKVQALLKELEKKL